MSPLSNSSSSTVIHEEEFVDMVEQLSEKAARLRESAMSIVGTALSSYICVEEGAKRTATLAKALTKIIRAPKSTVAERCKACRLASIVALIYGGRKIDDVCALLCEDISPVATDPSTPAIVRAATFETLGIVSFMDSQCDVDVPSHPTSVLPIFEDQFNNRKEPAVAIAALNSWGLIFTSPFISLSERCELMKKKFLQFMELLGSDSALVVIAAGENLALMAQFTEELGAKRHPHTKELISILEEMNKTQDHTASKDDRKVQKAALRRVLMMFTEGEWPEEIIKVKGKPIEFSSWDAIRQLESFRAALGHGLSAHLALNPNLRQLFEIECDLTGNAAKLSKVQRHLMQAENAEKEKKISIKRSKERSKFGEIHNAED